MNKTPRKARTHAAYLMESLRNPEEALAYIEASFEFGDASILRAVWQIALANKWKEAIKAWRRYKP